MKTRVSLKHFVTDCSSTLSILKCGLGVIHIDTQLSSLKIKGLFNPINALWKDLILHQLTLILNFNQDLALSRQIQILMSNRHKIFKNRTRKISFIKLLNAWLHLINNIIPKATSLEEIIDQLIFSKPHTKLDFKSDNLHFYCVPPRTISDKFTLIRKLCRYLQPGLIYYEIW